ncbi:toxin-activating lysine-acyltransferase [Roseibium aggregatum]|uniref:toxin-activating lysine-acyltransferase n=1 Tax=Roseibium aggregatum TaxID=187304 RepID=UPI001E511CC8|nr:toxin-activating lysine-acyltransferase [Roseibium aggregatum]UES54000.1 toxin-activating lysine-acyltransferase [Roseibium aggregatum]
MSTANGPSTGKSRKATASKTSPSDNPGAHQKAAETFESAKQNVVRMTAVGHACWLMSRSPLHKHMMITDIEWLVLPPIMLNQFRLWQHNGMPIGFASWAYLGEEASERIVEKGIRRLMPTDWKSGEDLWLIDFIAPMGGQDEMIKELRENIFKGKPFKSLQPTAEGKVGVKEW